MIMTQEQKAKRYNEALERARAFNNGEDVNIEAGTTLCEYIFPELKESEDEKVEKAIFGMVYDSDNELWSSYDVSKSDVLVWLENQGEQKTIEEVNGEDYGIDGLWHAQRILEKTLGSVNGYQSDDGILDHKAAITAVKKLYEQKPVNKIEPKFHEGDWITNANGNYTWKVISVDDLDYTLQNQCGACVEDTVDYVNKAFHLWTIEDAKDGDILFSRSSFIYGKQCPYGGINWYNNKFSKVSNFIFIDSPVHPATKEQRDFLFQKMKEAGYEWIADKKELKKEEEK